MPDETKLRISLDGLLRNAGCAATAGEGTYGRMHAYDLEQLGKHLRELRDRWKAGDTGVVDEFFDLYVLE